MRDGNAFLIGMNIGEDVKEGKAIYLYPGAKVHNVQLISIVKENCSSEQ